ncbi:hypothetical protein ACPOL_2766 [Acidisarcina polymorpha]|uniref:Uncharacterized protein n=1 Tax=Acidisarcina polymorpha TaxID=2211140 RepID=A0A2Z5G017_9BACT|nr:hypothetical protein ACPOL_2766 [Acidisarcina polymorpha]
MALEGSESTFAIRISSAASTWGSFVVVELVTQAEPRDQSFTINLAHLYAISYYPQPNPNHGWRSITVKLNGKDMRKYHIRTRDGYRLQQIKSDEEDVAHTLTSNTTN